jgi:hypothetical protein
LELSVVKKYNENRQLGLTAGAFLLYYDYDTALSKRGQTPLRAVWEKTLND